MADASLSTRPRTELKPDRRRQRQTGFSTLTHETQTHRRRTAEQHAQGNLRDHQTIAREVHRPASQARQVGEPAKPEDIMTPHLEALRHVITTAKPKKELIGIYAIVCKINGKAYVGSTVHFRRRWDTHRGYLQNGKHSNPILQSAWNKHGAESFEFRVIEVVQNCEDLAAKLADREQFWIESIGSYNCQPAKPSPNMKRTYTPEQRSRAREAQLRRIKRDGFTHSPEARRKISLANKGRVMSSEWLAKISASSRGHKKPESLKLAVSKSRSEKWLVTFPNGETRIVFGLLKFCRENNLHYELLRRTSKGIMQGVNKNGVKITKRCISHRGYKCRNITIPHITVTKHEQLELV